MRFALFSATFWLDADGAIVPDEWEGRSERAAVVVDAVERAADAVLAVGRCLPCALARVLRVDWAVCGTCDGAGVAVWAAGTGILPFTNAAKPDLTDREFRVAARDVDRGRRDSAIVRDPEGAGVAASVACPW